VIESTPYIMEMGDVLGKPVKHWPIYVFSPLRLTGESLDAALMFEDRFEQVEVGSMPAVGATTPIRPLEALAVAAADVVGSALILSQCIKPSLSWGISIFPFDPRGMAMSLGSPEHILFSMAATEVDAFLHGDQWHPAGGDAQTLAKRPGPQAAAEKASGMATGALLGARYFGGAGALSLDEVFSSIQLAIDLEIKNHVERLVNGLDTRMQLENLTERVAAGLSRGFMSSEETLNEYRHLYWLPDLFERRFLASWQAAGEPDILEIARAVVDKAVSGYTYRPPDDVLRDIAKVYARAERELA